MIAARAQKLLLVRRAFERASERANRASIDRKSGIRSNRTHHLDFFERLGDRAVAVGAVVTFGHRQHQAHRIEPVPEADRALQPTHVRDQHVVADPRQDIDRSHDRIGIRRGRNGFPDAQNWSPGSRGTPVRDKALIRLILNSVGTQLRWACMPSREPTSNADLFWQFQRRPRLEY